MKRSVTFNISPRQHIIDRARAEQALGHPLLPHQHVHHFTPTQLVICEDSAYHSLLHMREFERKLTLNPAFAAEELAKADAMMQRGFRERNLLLLALIRHAGFDAHLTPPAKPDPGNWDRVLCLHTPAGQLHWKLSPFDQQFFEHLPYVDDGHYDGCKAAEKAERLERLAA